MESLDDRLHLHRQRRQAQHLAAFEEQARLKAELATEVARLTEDARARLAIEADALSDRVISAHAGVDVVAGSIVRLEDHTAGLSARITRSEADLRRWQRRLALTGVLAAVLAAAIIALVALWATQMHAAAKNEVAQLRAAQTSQLEAARQEGEAAIADLQADVDGRRSELQASLDALGSDLAALTSERDAVRADLETLIILRDRLGFTLIDHHSGPVIVVPEDREIRKWSAPGLLPIARYNGRMYRVMAERK